MRFACSVSLLLAASASASLLACFPVHSVTIGRRDPGYPGPGHPPVVEEEHGHGGPPPWAPAHGYRHHQEHAYQSRAGEVELVFDSGLGVYAVVGFPNYYYWDGSYLRIESGQWLTAAYLDAPWAPCPADRIPGGLRAKSGNGDHGHGKADHGKGHGHGHGAAKHSDD
jgi:hypothetical protein